MTFKRDEWILNQKLFFNMVQLMVKRDINFGKYGFKGHENSMISGVVAMVSDLENISEFMKGSGIEETYQDVSDALNKICLKDKATVFLPDENKFLYNLRIIDLTDVALSKVKEWGWKVGCFEDVLERFYGKKHVGTKRELTLALALALEKPVFVMSQTVYTDVGTGRIYWLDKSGVKYMVYLASRDEQVNLIIEERTINNNQSEKIAEFEIPISTIESNEESFYDIMFNQDTIKQW